MFINNFLKLCGCPVGAWKMGSRLAVVPVACHQLRCPGGLVHGLSGQEFLHHRLDVQHRCAVNRVHFPHRQSPTFNPYDFADCAADSVGTIFGSLREDANLGPSFVVPGMSLASYNFVVGHLMENKKNMDNLL